MEIKRNKHLRDPDAFLKWAAPKLQGGGERFVLLDEVQLLSDFVPVVTSRQMLQSPQGNVTPIFVGAWRGSLADGNTGF